MFEAKDHFKTYPSERNPSFGANCNVLICLLKLEDPSLYIPQITKVIGFLAREVFRGGVNDKWASTVAPLSC